MRRHADVSPVIVFEFEQRAHHRPVGLNYGSYPENMQAGACHLTTPGDRVCVNSAISRVRAQKPASGGDCRTGQIQVNGPPLRRFHVCVSNDKMSLHPYALASDLAGPYNRDELPNHIINCVVELTRTLYPRFARLKGMDRSQERPVSTSLELRL